MLDNEPEGGELTGAQPADQPTETAANPRRTRAPRKRTAAKATAGSETASEAGDAAAPTGGSDAATQADAVPSADAPAERAPARRRRATKAVAEPIVASVEPDEDEEAAEPVAATPPAEPVTTAPAEPVAAAEEEPPTGRRRRGRAVAPSVLFMAPDPATLPVTPPPAPKAAFGEPTFGQPVAAFAAPVAAFGEPTTSFGEPTTGSDEEPAAEPRRRRSRRGTTAEPVAVPIEDEEPAAEADADAEGDEDWDDENGPRRRRRGRRGRGRGKGPAEDGEESTEATADADSETAESDDDDDEPLTRRRRRRRRKGAAEDGASEDDGVPTVVRIREPRRPSDEVQGVTGSTRLEAKRQRRRDGRDQRRTRPPILTESEFLARRESVDRVMVVRQRGDRTQIAVMEDNVLVEHYVTRSSSGTMVGNVYLGKVQNVLPSMEAAFVDVGRGRNAVLYAGEVNWDATGLEGRSRSIEQALRPGDPVLVQVTKDPIGHKGARLSSHVALSGRHLVYVPNGNASGISRKLPDNERKRLRDALKKLVPDGAGVIVRTAAEGATEEELARDVTRLQSQWDSIQANISGANAPAALYEEPDLVIRVVRDLFNEDFRELVIQGEEAYGEIEAYLGHVSPDLLPRLKRHTGVADVFAELRIDEQILKALDKKVFLPSGGYLVIDRTEAMTVVDVNTGKYTGAGGNLEETVTRNNLEAAEEIVRQLRLRDLGGIVVIDFIDMVLESNRDLVLRRLTECLGRDRTKHQVTEITSLGLVQMTRKRIGAGLLEAFSENCEHCKGRGLVIHAEPVAEKGGNSRPAGVEKVKAVAAAPAKTENVSGRRRGRKVAVIEDAVEVLDDELVAELDDEPIADLVDAPAVVAEPATVLAAPVASAPYVAPATPAPAVTRPTTVTPPAVMPAVPTVSGVATGYASAVAPVAAAVDDDPYDTQGYDLSRYGDWAPAAAADDDIEELELTGAAAQAESEEDAAAQRPRRARRRSRT